MSLIKPRTRGKQLVKHRTRLDRETHETLYAYAQFIGEPTEYVLNQVIDTVLAKDKEFLQWRDTHPDSYVPRGASARGTRGRVAGVGAYGLRAYPFQGDEVFIAVIEARRPWGNA